MDLSENIYLVCDDKVIIDDTEIEDFESRSCVKLPLEYINFVKEYGIGTYCGILRINRPSEIEIKSIELSDMLESHYWENDEIKNFVKSLKSPIQICESIDCDRLFFVENFPNKFFVLPRHDSKLYTLNSGFYEPTLWYVGDKAVRPKEIFKYFEPDVDSKIFEIIINNANFIKNEFFSLIKEWFSSEILEADYSSDIFLFVKQIEGIIHISLDDILVSVRFEYRPIYHEFMEKLFTKIFMSIDINHFVVYE